MYKTSELLPLDVAFAGSACWYPLCSANVIGVSPEEKHDSQPGQSKRLLRCTRCMLAFFCNASCQKAYWPVHKSHCKALAKREVSEVAGLPWVVKVGLTKQQLVKSLQRPLRLVEETALVLEAQCCVSGCNVTRTGGGGRKLSACSKCGWGHVCKSHTSAELAKATSCHSALCKTFQQNNALAVFRRRHIVKAGDPFCFTPGRQRVGYLLPQGWAEYFSSSVPEDLRLQLAHVPQFFQAATPELTQSLSTLLGIQHFGLHKQGVAGTTSLRVHVVGAARFEWPASETWELLLHHIPTLRNLQVDFVGPDISKDMKPMDMECCPECVALSCKRVYSAGSALYHSYRDSSQYKKPDIVVAFNSGIHEVDVEKWKPTLELLIQENIPCVFTSYNESEAMRDQAALEALGGDVTLTTQRNPFRSQWPMIETSAIRGKIPFYYSNNYLLCMQGALACTKQNIEESDSEDKITAASENLFSLI